MNGTQLRVGIKLAIAVSLVFLCPTTGRAKAAPKKPPPRPTASVSAPQKAALSWVALTDASKYAESWDAASPTFQSTVTKARWVTIVQPVRDPLGKAQSRILKIGQHTTSLPGGSFGDYVVLIYSTTFAKRGAMQETVILNHDKDGKWRMSGYYIRPVP